MTDPDNSAFSNAKLRDYVIGEIKKNRDLYPHTGLVEPGSTAGELLNFVESIYSAEDYDVPPSLSESSAGSTLRRRAATDRVGGSIQDLPSYAVGLTETEVDISQVQIYSKLANSILNEGAPYTAVIFGGMNRGKTSFAGLWLEIWRDLVPLKYGTEDYVVLSNMRTLDEADELVTDIETLKRLVFGDDEYIETGGEKGTPPEIPSETPVWWHFDECSTHLDARTKGYEVPNLYLPLVKRFAKVNLDGVHLGHSGMDIHADMRRSHITTEFVFKTGLKTAEVYDSMYEDHGANHKYTLTEVPPTNIKYDPDDYSPFSWE
jgi:hypothetical protein